MTFFTSERQNNSPSEARLVIGFPYHHLASIRYTD